MGTDLEATIQELKRIIKYYNECCRPTNKEAIELKLKELIKTLEAEDSPTRPTD